MPAAKERAEVDEVVDVEPVLPEPMVAESWLRDETIEEVPMPDFSLVDTHEFALSAQEQEIDLAVDDEGNLYERSEADTELALDPFDDLELQPDYQELDADNAEHATAIIDEDSHEIAAESEPEPETVVTVLPMQVQAQMAVYRELAEPDEVEELDRLTERLEAVAEAFEVAVMESMEATEALELDDAEANEEAVELVLVEAEADARQTYKELLTTIGVAEAEQQEIIDTFIEVLRIRAAARPRPIKLDVSGSKTTALEKQFVEDYEMLKRGVKVSFSKAIGRAAQLLGSFTVVKSVQFQG